MEIRQHNIGNYVLRVIYALVLVVYPGFTVYPNEIYYEVVGTDIAPNTENLKTLKDSYGFLWVGSTSGVDCFDGNGVSIFEDNTNAVREVSGLSVSTFFEDGEDVWIGTDKGLYIYNRIKNRVERFPLATKYGVVVSAQIKKILAADDGTIWIGTLGQGIFRFDPVSSQLAQESRYGSFYTDMALGADGLIYGVTISGLVNSFKPSGELVQTLRIPDYINEKHNIFLVSFGRDIWIGTGHTICKLQLGSGEILQANTAGLLGTISSMFARRDGTIWASTGEGIFCYDSNSDNITKISRRKLDNNLTNARVVSMMEDNDGNIVIIPGAGAIDVLVTKPLAIQFIGLESDANTSDVNTVRAIVRTADNAGLWIGADKGLLYYDIRQDKFYKSPKSELANIPISTLALDGSNLWIGTHNRGVYKYNTADKSLRHYTYNENKSYSVISNDINHIGITHRGEVLILTNWGICKYDPNADNFPQLPEIEQSTHAITMQSDDKGGDWISSSNNGMYYRAPGSNRFERAGWCASIESTPINMLKLSHNGRLWAASSKGDIFVYDDTLRDFQRIDLPVVNNSNLTFIAPDSNDNLWVASDKVLAQLNATSNIRQFNFSRQANHLPIASAVVDIGKDSFAIGCHNGMMVFEPSKLKQYEYKTHVYPLKLSFPFSDNNPTELDRLGLNKLLLTSSSIELPYNNNTFTIKFASSRPLIESDVRYDYMLKGVDKGWIIGSVMPEVTYNNVPPGNYEFLLRPHGIDSAEPAVMAVSVLPPWYRTNWAYFGYSIAIVLLIWAIYLTSRALIRRNLARKVTEVQVQKERENFEAKTRYFVDLVHEIRTPLMLISLPLEQLADTNSRQDSAEPTGRYIKSMQQNIDYLLGITNQLLDFRRVENNHEVRLNYTRCNITNMIKHLYSRFEEPLKVSGKQIVLDLPEADVWATLDVDKTERLFMNLIGNGMKYAKSEVTVRLADSTEGTVTIAVIDDGPGVPDADRDKIFDTYYQIGNDKVAATLGTGLGLAYAKLIASAHKGDIRVGDNAAGRGAMFTITLPKGDDIVIPNQVEIDRFSDSIETVAPLNQNTTVLLVEDNDDLRNMITESIGRHYNVVAATDGNSALKVLDANNVDIIVSDVMMEGMDGMELCQTVKSNLNYSHIPFIILTAMTSSEAHEKGLECGADAYLEKPFPIKQLVLQIENLLRTRRTFYERISSMHPSEAAQIAQSGLNRQDAEFLQRMNAHIEESIKNEDFSIDALAQSMNMSRSSFYRKITGIVGMSPNEYLKTFRLNHAARLLADGCRVTEVAESVGFTSSSYFAKCFREKFGVLPSDYVASLTSKTENGQ